MWEEYGRMAKRMKVNLEFMLVNAEMFRQD